MSLRRAHSPADRTPSPAFAQSVERNPVAKFLARRLVAEVCPVRNVLSLRSGDPLNIALNVMADAGVQSAPVVNQHGGVVGILSVLDVVRHLAAAVPDAAAATEDQLRAADLASTSAEGLLRELGPPPEPAPVFDAQPALFLLDVLKANPRVVVFSEVFGEAPGDRGSHVEMSRVCSRADLLRLVNASREDPLLRPVLQASLQESGYRPGRVVSVPQDATVLQAAAAMARGGLSAVALLDSNGRLAGALTSRDLRGLRGAPESLRDLLLPCAVYLASRGGSGPGGLAEVVRVSPGDTFGKAVALMVSQGLHEAWVCEGGFAQGVVTAADAVAWLAAARAAGALSREIRLQGVAFRLPGPLNVRVLACDNLPAGTAAPTVECVVGRTGPRFTTRAGPSGPSPSWRDEGADLQLTEEFLGNNLNFTVRDGDEVLGYVRVPVKWVVSAFGTRAPAVVTFRDTYRLEDADQGDLELEFLWKGH